MLSRGVQCKNSTHFYWDSQQMILLAESLLDQPSWKRKKDERALPFTFYQAPATCQVCSPI